MRIVNGQAVLTIEEQRDSDLAEDDLDAIVTGKGMIMAAMEYLHRKLPNVDQAELKAIIEDYFTDTYAAAWCKNIDESGSLAHTAKIPSFEDLRRKP